MSPGLLTHDPPAQPATPRAVSAVRATCSQLAADDPGWRAFATQHAEFPLQHPDWLDTLTSAYGLRARVTALIDPRGSILAGLPAIRAKLPWRRAWTSLPFTDTFEPIAATRADRDRLLAAIAEYATDPTARGEEARCEPVRCEPVHGELMHGETDRHESAGDEPARGEPVLLRSHADLPGWTARQVGTVQTIDLSEGVDGVLRGAKPKTRQNIKLARKAGVTARPIVSREEFMGANLDLIARSRRRLGAPTQPRRYWSRVWELHERGQALTIGVYLRETLVANAIFVIGARHATFKYSASETQTRNLRSNYLAFATALEHLQERGTQSLDFGITDLHNTSLRRYKVHWGGEEQPAYFSATDAALLPDTLEPGRLVTKAIQRSPVFVGRAIGSLAYPFVA